MKTITINQGSRLDSKLRQKIKFIHISSFLRLILTLSFVYLGCAPTIQAQWRSIGPPGFSLIRSITINHTNPLIIYVLSELGLSKSTNGGISWHKINFVPPESSLLPYPDACAIDQTNAQIIYLSIGGIYKSTDGGMTWNKIEQRSFYSLAIDPQNSQILYGGYWGGMSKSIDGGTTWNEINSGLIPRLSNVVIPTCLTIDPFNTNIIYAISGFDGPYKSIDGGANWITIDQGLRGEQLTSFEIDINNHQILYAGTANGSIYMSNYGSVNPNGNTSWTNVFQGLGLVTSILSDPMIPDFVYATIGGNLYKSISNGSTWGRMNSSLMDNSSGIPCISEAWSLSFHPQNDQILYAGSICGGVFKSTDAGTSWIQLNSPSYWNILSIASGPPNTIYCGSDFGMFKSTNNGSGWKPLASGSFNVRSIAVSSSNTQVVYYGNETGLYKSNDGGETWHQVSIPVINSVSSIISLAIDPSNDMNIYAGSEGGGMLLSSNGGSTWKNGRGIPLTASVFTLVIDFANTDIIYAGTGEGLYKSKNKGNTWTQIGGSLLGGTAVYSIAIKDLNNTQVIYAGTENRGIYSSLNGGRSWNSMNVGIPSSTSISSLNINGKVIYAGSLGSGLYKSSNGGQSWHREYISSNDSYINCLSSGSKVICAGTKDDGIIRFFPMIMISRDSPISVNR